MNSHKIFGFAGYSGAGKTTLIEQIIKHLTSSGVRVALIKHAHHNFDIDIPGKDSYRHRAAGASEVLIAGGQRWALMHELKNESEPSLAELLSHLSVADIVLIEGFKRYPIPKLEIWREANGKALLFPDDPHIIGIASDDDLPTEPLKLEFSRFGLGQIAEIADFVMHQSRVFVQDVGALQH